ncbi:MAG: NAD(P)/FAD-dependent oxidoreductase [Cytophagaceae bacterium]|nr:NAD(P)/FAD-dependent oxidoreductase [Cytophagaceae bacterium]
MKDIIIIGGGIAGLINAIQLADAGLDVLVIEKKIYPFHRVCGEYISNESLPFLKSIDADPFVLQPAEIKRLMVTSPSGTKLEMKLDMGGFGVSRFAFDNYLYSVAIAKGTMFLLNTAVMDVKFDNNCFHVLMANGDVEEGRIVVGSFGKRSNLDRQLNRKFFSNKSPYLAVKHHIKTDFPEDMIALHSFKDGYCGISKVEEDKYCLCYMTSRENLKQSGTIDAMQKDILFKNPFLKNIFSNAEFLYEAPEVINEISFDTKTPVENHILMSGDAAGMITPLCGNGMSMAIHSAKILSSLIMKHYSKMEFNRESLEKEYTFMWKSIFEQRLFVGRKIQQLFGKEMLTDFAVRFLRNTPPVARWIVKQTHGEVF